MYSPQTIALPGAQLDFYPQLALPDTPGALFAQLMVGVNWRSESITLFGRRMAQPRLIAWYGDPGASYGYSGKRFEPQPWTPPLRDIRKCLEETLDASFNSVLANLYRHERDSMGLHADNEPELGDQPVIASVSLGETRVFRLKHATRRDLKPLKLELPSGSLLVMRGDTQRYWKHEVPKSRRPCGPRINLTYRLVKQSAQARKSQL